MKQFGDYTYFLYVGNNPNYSFRNYVDPLTGQERGYVVGFDKNGQPLYKEWFFNYSSKRQIRVSNSEVDLKGQKAVDFLRSSPEFYGNKNGHYVDDRQVLFMFKEINEEAEAAAAVDARMVTVNAQAKAGALKGQELQDVAAIIGVFSPSESVRKHRVLDFAANFPDKFLALVDDPLLKIRSLIRKGINDNVLKVTGRVISWEGQQIGADEDDAVSTLSKDAKLKSAIELNLKKFGNA